MHHFEPSLALYINDEDYDQWFKLFFEQALECLKPGGIFLMEGHEHHLSGQMKFVSELSSVAQCELIKDLNSEDRFLKFRKKMDKLVVTGQNQLKGEIKVSKAKNATLPILFGVILNPNKITINELPKLKDIQTTKKLLEMLGVIHEENGVETTFDASNVKTKEATYELVKTMRVSDPRSIAYACSLWRVPRYLFLVAVPLVGVQLIYT